MSAQLSLQLLPAHVLPGRESASYLRYSYALPDGLPAVVYAYLSHSRLQEPLEVARAFEEMAALIRKQLGS